MNLTVLGAGAPGERRWRRAPACATHAAVGARRGAGRRDAARTLQCALPAGRAAARLLGHCSDFDAALAHARDGLLVIATPMAGLEGLLRASAPRRRRPACCGCARASRKAGRLGHEIARDVAPALRCGVLSGPSFAIEVARGQPTALVAASAMRRWRARRRGLPWRQPARLHLQRSGRRRGRRRGEERDGDRHRHRRRHGARAERPRRADHARPRRDDAPGPGARRARRDLHGPVGPGRPGAHHHRRSVAQPPGRPDAAGGRGAAATSSPSSATSPKACWSAETCCSARAASAWRCRSPRRWSACCGAPHAGRGARGVDGAQARARTLIDPPRRILHGPHGHAASTPRAPRRRRAAAATPALPARAQAWPARPIRWSCRSRPAARPTSSARIVAEPLGGARPAGRGRQRPGAGGNVGTGRRHAEPDGYTPLFTIQGPLVTAPLLAKALATTRRGTRAGDAGGDLAQPAGGRSGSARRRSPISCASPRRGRASSTTAASAMAARRTWRWNCSCAAPAFRSVHVPYQGFPQMVNAPLAGQVQAGVHGAGHRDGPGACRQAARHSGLDAGPQQRAPEFATLAEQGYRRLRGDLLAGRARAGEDARGDRRARCRASWCASCAATMLRAKMLAQYFQRRGHRAGRARQPDGQRARALGQGDRGGGVQPE